MRQSKKTELASFNKRIFATGLICLGIAGCGSSERGTPSQKANSNVRTEEPAQIAGSSLSSRSIQSLDNSLGSVDRKLSQASQEARSARYKEIQNSREIEAARLQHQASENDKNRAVQQNDQLISLVSVLALSGVMKYTVTPDKYKCRVSSSFGNTAKEANEALAFSQSKGGSAPSPIRRTGIASTKASL